MYEAVVVSDIHIGSNACQTDLIVQFLENIKSGQIETERLIIVGDLFDSFDCRLNKSHWKILGLLRKLSNDMGIYWIKGNHDSYADASVMANILGVNFLTDYYILESSGKKTLFVHGDIFDDFISKHPIITAISDWIYWLLLKIDKTHAIAQFAKRNSKSYLHCSDKVEKGALALKEKFECDYVCSGHTHFAVSNEPYFNCGSWCEIPVSYLTIKDGKIDLIFVRG